MSKKCFSFKNLTIKRSLFFSFLFFCILFPLYSFAAPLVPQFSMQMSAGDASPEYVTAAFEIMFLLTVLTVAPSIILMVTSYTRIIIVFYFLRQAIGLQSMPPNQVLASLAIFMTFTIMLPTGQAVYQDAVAPYLAEDIGYTEAFKKAEAPVRSFLFKHTREKDLSIFYSIAKIDRPENKEEVPTAMLIAAFMISELKTGFTIGFLIYIPFLVLDMVVSSVLLSMGMMMLPPAMVSMPFKLLLFILVDGWNLLIGSIVNTF